MSPEGEGGALQEQSRHLKPCLWAYIYIYRAGNGHTFSLTTGTPRRARHKPNTDLRSGAIKMGPGRGTDTYDTAILP